MAADSQTVNARGSGAQPGRFRSILVRNGLINNAGTFVALVTGLVMVPVLLAGLGVEAYGGWLMLMAVTTLVTSLDFGLAVVVTRDVARARLHGQEAARASAAGGGMLLLGVVTGSALCLTGLAMEHWGRPVAGLSLIGPLSFGLVGMALFAEQVVQYGNAVLAGVQRFGLANALTGGGTVLRAAAIASALALDAGLLGVAIAHAAGCALTAGCMALALRRLTPLHTVGRARFDLRALRPEVRFSLATLVATFAGAILWHVHPLLIGWLIGPASVVAYHVGMRLTLLCSEMSWRAAEVIVPAVGAAPSARVSGMALSTGLRGLTLAIVPVAVSGSVLAPELLEWWLSEVPDGAVLVMRVGLVALVLDAWAVVAIQILWGLGKGGRTAGAMVVAALCAVLLDLVLAPHLGATAAPAAIAAGLAGVAGATLAAAAVLGRVGLGEIVARNVLPMLPAAIVCGASAWLGAWLAGEPAAARATLGVLFGLGGYAVTIWMFGMSTAERDEVRRVARRVVGLPDRAIGLLRARLKKVGSLRSAWYLMIVLRRRMAYRPAKISMELDRLFDTASDPWGYRSATERERHGIAEDMLRSIDDSQGLERVLEIGCAEGAFTERLAPLGASLLAVERSPIALRRAASRRDWERSVRFAQLDLRTDPVPGLFSTVVVMDVLTYFESTRELRAIREKIVNALEPGGWLMVGDVRQSEVYESSWWGRWLLCGGLRICEFVARHPSLEQAAEASTATHVFRLLRKIR